MPLIAHDHAYEHPHHGVGLREEGGNGNGSGSGGLVMPVPVPVGSSSLGDRDDDEGNPHTLPRLRNMPSPAAISNRSGISTAFPSPQPLSPTEPLPPAMMHRAGGRERMSFPQQRDGKGSALRDSVVADEEFDTTFFPPPPPFSEDSQGERGRGTPPSPASTVGPSRRGTATATDDDEIVKSPTMMNPGRNKKRNNRNKKKKRNVRLAGAAAAAGVGDQTTMHAAETTKTTTTNSAAAPGVGTSPTRARRPSQFAHTTPGPATAEKTSRNMAGVGYHWLSNTGSEPGVDVTQDVGDYVNLTDPVRVTIVDYSSDGQGTRVDVPGKKLKMWLNSVDGARPVQPTPGTEGDQQQEGKRSVRWINVDGINFETLKFLTLRYGLHPLAVEDTLRASNNPRSKLDFYANHLYLQILVQHIRSEDQDEIRAAGSRKARRAGANARAGRSRYGSTDERSPPPPGSGESEEEGSNDGGEDGEDENGDIPIDQSADKTYQSSVHVESGIVRARARHRHRHHHTGSSSAKRAAATAAAAAEDKYNDQPSGWRRLFGLGRGKGMTSLPEGVEGVFEPIQTIQPGHANTPARNAHSMTIDHLAAQYMIPLRRSVMSVFMMRDGTLITMSASPYSGILDPIYLRLENKNGLLRRTCDASMLMEALLDVVVDIAIEITQAFESEILKMEAGCLVNPQMESVRHLHIISSQLTRLKRTLSPLAHVLYTLRDRDSQRALVSALYGSPHGEATKDPHHTSSALGFDSTHSTGYISQTTKVYLSDVIDHIDTMLTSLDQYLMTCDHLTDYIFNCAQQPGFILLEDHYIKNAFRTVVRVVGRKRREEMVMRYERDEKNRVYRRD
ncbi:hypothetical protein QFC21_000896 [Naganishia friedmannii]|uniref:Uncharacterized protein n=1 Tax=Naganishia friedmannii TaxID=89922 RepID=A0ACC2W7L9_9TREE|nr:hypothetical protein QFC21_000896 [Naganishia friedmannii]